MATQKSTYTVAQYRDRVRGDLGLRSQSLLTDAEIDAWGQRAARLVAEHTHWLRKSATAATADGVPLVDLPADLLALEEVWHEGLKLCRVSIRQIERWHGTEDWRALEGTPTHYYLRGMTALGLYLTPDTTDADALTLHYTYFPAAPSGDSDFYTVPTALDESLIAYGKMRASEKDKSGEGRLSMELYRGEWNEWLRKLRALVEDVDEGQTLIRGEDEEPMEWGYGRDYIVPAP